MKKASVAILAFVYIIIACGVVVNLHYCMGKLAGVTLGYNHNDGCAKPGMKDSKGCCHNEYKVVKLQESHQPETYAISFGASPAELVPFYASESDVVQKTEFLSLQYHSPPDPRLNSVYLQNCVFRI